MAERWQNYAEVTLKNGERYPVTLREIPYDKYERLLAIASGGFALFVRKEQADPLGPVLQEKTRYYVAYHPYSTNSYKHV